MSITRGIVSLRGCDPPFFVLKSKGDPITKKTSTRYEKSKASTVLLLCIVRVSYAQEMNPKKGNCKSYSFSREQIKPEKGSRNLYLSDNQ